MPSTALPGGVPAPPAFIRAARLALREPPAGVDPWFHRYHGDLLDDRGLRTWVRAKRQLLDLVGGAGGKVVVDAGSGFGMVSNLLASWGARHVCALEVHTPMARTHALVNARHFPDLAGGPAPASPYRHGQCPCEPEWGYVLEPLFDGRDLAAKLARRGFEARELPTHRWARAYRVVGRRR